jgi:hypothetical protein
MVTLKINCVTVTLAERVYLQPWIADTGHSYDLYSPKIVVSASGRRNSQVQYLILLLRCTGDRENQRLLPSFDKNVLRTIYTYDTRQDPVNKTDMVPALRTLKSYWGSASLL